MSALKYLMEDLFALGNNTIIHLRPQECPNCWNQKTQHVDYKCPICNIIFCSRCPKVVTILEKITCPNGHQLSVY